MATVKGKGSSMGHRYTPASEFDDATLAQKREYWRNKKREQRARLSESRGTVPKPSLNVLAPASSIPLQARKISNQPPNISTSLQIGNIGASTSFVAPQCQKEQWLQTMNLNKLPGQNMSNIEVKCTPQVVNSSVNSVLVSQLNSSPSVPPLTNSCSSQPCISMQVQSIPKTSPNAPIPVLIHPNPDNITTVLSPLPCSSKSTPQSEKKSALVTQQKPTNASNSPAKMETEEEKAAKRREQWRIKKREQRAKLAAKLGKTRNRAQNVEVWTQKQHSGNTASIDIPAQSLIESGSIRKTEIQTNMATFHSVPSVAVVKKSVEPIRKSPIYFHLSGVTRARCPTPRQNFIKQKFLKLKSSSLSYLCGNRGLPQIDPSDTPEQVVAKRREYWRVKPEQRAKLSMEVKSRMKEKDGLQSRVKQYHKILEDMRKARSQSIMHASETIGGFIKEDGTVTINIPQVTVNCSMPAQADNIDALSTQPQGNKPNFQHPAPRPVQVKISVPPTGQRGNKPPRILRPQMGTTSNSQILPQESHLMLTHPPASLNTGSGSTTGGCVMKMAVSCKAPSLSMSYLDPSLTEEERMAKRREYWRVKKREQRAARATRLRQGVSQARASAVLLKRKAQKHFTGMPISKRLPNQTGSTTNNNVAALPYVNEIKQENKFMPAVDLNSDQAICPDLKPPVSRTPPPAQADPDPALCADSQATTLLAVASMKKLLEESLSNVAECQTETGIKMETEEEKVEQNNKPDVSQVDVCAPITADVTLQIENCKEDGSQINEDSTFMQKDMSQITSSSTLHSSPDSSPQTPSSFIETPKIETFECSQRRTQRTKKAGHQHCCSPEPPKLHHPPIETHTETQDLNHSRATSNKCPHVMETGMNSLQTKREYWKLMKRQQRARLKARQRSNSNMASIRNVQSSGYNLNKSPVVKPALLPKPSTPSGTTMTSIPSVLVVSSTAANTEPQGTLRVKPPVPSRDSNTDCRIKNDNRSSKVNSSPLSLPTLKPPDNPLSSINMQPIEPPCQNVTRTLRSMTNPCPPKQDSAQKLASPVKSVSTLVPPKPIPGESDEDFQKRKREYWRIKKKEQRARKAFHDKGKSPKPSWSQTLPQTQPQAQPQEESNEWAHSSDEPEDLINNSADSDGGSFTYPSYTVSVEDEVYPDYEGPSGDEGSASEDFWRNHYLMDYDPLNQLLVCMVCGDLQYVHSLEGVRAHIEESHPDTLNLESGERQRILQAWDEQVFQRERFFTNQLQQQSTSTAGGVSTDKEAQRN